MITTFDPLHVGCCIVPDFVEEQDGFYTKRVVLDKPIVAGFIETDVPELSSFHIESLREPVPRYKKHLVWRTI